MLICFFDQKGTVHKQFVPPGQTVNAAFYVEVLKRLLENVEGMYVYAESAKSLWIVRVPRIIF